MTTLLEKMVDQLIRRGVSQDRAFEIALSYLREQIQIINKH
jgi:hypothetical protein